MVQQSYPRHQPFHRAIRRESVRPSFVLMAMVQQSYPRHPSFHHTIRRESAAPSFVLMGDGVRRLPRRGYTFDRAGLMSAAKSTLSDDVHHRMLPPWGLYFFNFPHPFPAFGDSVARRGSRLRIAFGHSAQRLGACFCPVAAGG